MAIITPDGYIVGRKDGKYPITSDVDIKLVRGRIMPCESCKRRTYCAMYFSFTRNRLRSNYLHGTNILHHCMIYVPDKIPGKNRAWNYGNTSKHIDQNDDQTSP